MLFVVTNWQGNVMRVKIMKAISQLLALIFPPVVMPILSFKNASLLTIILIGLAMNFPVFCYVIVGIFPPPKTRIWGDRFWTFIGCYARPLRGRFEALSSEQTLQPSAYDEYLTLNDRIRDVQGRTDAIV
jgi:hypothetical protein